jgi:hypothetical protein
MRDMEKLPGLHTGGKFLWHPVSFTQNVSLHKPAWSWYRRALQGSVERLLEYRPMQSVKSKAPASDDRGTHPHVQVTGFSNVRGHHGMGSDHRGRQQP